METEKKRYLEGADITRQASGHWIYLFSLLTSIGKAADDFNGSGSATGTAKNRSACPVHSGKSNDAFYLHNDADKTGRGGCNSCGSHQGLGLIMWATGWDFRRTLEAVADALDIDETERADVKTRSTKPVHIEPRALTEAELASNTKKVKQMNDLWNESYPLDHIKSKPARLYYRNRGLEDVGLLNGEVRMHPGVKYWVEGKNKKYHSIGTFCCIISAVTLADGSSGTLHRTFITKDGFKADVPDAKKLMASRAGISISGGSIELSPPNIVMGVAEGKETALAAKVGTGMSVHSCVNASMLANWDAPKIVKYAFIWKDKDQPDHRGVCAGDASAAKLREKLIKRGIKVFIMSPPLKGYGDWLDVLTTLGVEAFPDESKNWKLLGQVQP